MHGLVGSWEGRGLGRRPVRVIAAALAAAMIVVGCGGGGSHDSAAGPAGEKREPAKSSAAPASATVTPADGASGVRPDTTVRINAMGGTLTSVTVIDGDGTAVSGAISTDSTRWTATALLAPGSRYTVRAAVTDAHGRTVRSTASFSTLKVPRDKQLKASSIAPLAGSVAGVAQPLAVGFNAPVSNRAAVQNALRVESTPPVRGAWYWIDSEHVHFRPQAFWPAGTKVTLRAQIQGVDAGNGRWGAANRTISYTIARRQIINVDVKSLRMTVERSGKVIKRFRVTSGKRGWETRNGVKVVMDKVTDKTWTNESIDAPEEYELHSDWAMRMTDSGEFIHDAPWSLGNLGERSASHGCVGMRPADAKWLFANTLIGDPIVVTGSPRPYNDLANRYADWNVPWAKWSAGNA